jgi:hypothetical protein
MEAHHERPHFPQAQPLLAPAVATPLGYQVLLPGRLKPQTEVVNVAEQRYKLHHENLLGRAVWVALTTVLKRFLVAYSLRCAQSLDFVNKLRRTQVNETKGEEAELRDVAKWAVAQALIVLNALDEIMVDKKGE